MKRDSRNAVAPAGLKSWTTGVKLVFAVAVAFSAACGRRTIATPPSNDLLIVGYDREPDTMNRYSTHILEDIESCVVEGLVTSDEKMNVVPLPSDRCTTTVS